MGVLSVLRFALDFELFDFLRGDGLFALGGCDV